MSNDSEPLSKFQTGGRASIINYNIPDSTSYGGQGYIDLGIDPEWFVSEAASGPTYAEWVRDRYGIGAGELPEMEDGQFGEYQRIRDTIQDPDAFKRIQKDLEVQIEQGVIDDAGSPLVIPQDDPARMAVRDHVSTGGTGRRTGGGRGSYSTPLSLQSTAGTTPTGDASEDSEVEDDVLSGELSLDPELARSLRPDTIARDVLDNNIPLVYTGFSGVPSYESVPAPTSIEPRLMLVERYRISTYLGDYGAGRTLKTFSLLPGEETTISIRTYRHRSDQRKRAESILESKSRSAARSFEQEIEREQWDKESYQQSKSFTKTSQHSTSGGVNAGVNLGFVKFGANVEHSSSRSASVSKSSNVARSSFSRSAMNAVSESSSKASSHREVEVNTSQETTEETGYEKTTERSIENVNLSRTLNFVFRQLNQEFITVFHLEDVRVAYTSGAVSTTPSGQGIDGLEYREVPLWKLDELLADVIVEEHRGTVRDLIDQELRSVVDHDGDAHSIVEEEEIEDTNGQVVDTYLQIDAGTHEYTDPRVAPGAEADQQPIRVPGVILDVDRNRMRTDGVIVEALLGKGEALDDYMAGIQHAELAEQRLENDRLEAEIEQQQLAAEVAKTGNASDAQRYATVFDLDEDVADVDVGLSDESRDEADEHDRQKRPREQD